MVLKILEFLNIFYYIFQVKTWYSHKVKTMFKNSTTNLDLEYTIVNTVLVLNSGAKAMWELMLSLNIILQGTNVKIATKYLKFEIVF